MLEPDFILKEHYQLKQQLSKNPVRQTWLAEDMLSGEKVAIKLLTFGGQMQWEDLKLFEREAQVLKQLNHPQIPKYRDYFAVDGPILWFALVQDYIAGASLKQLLEEGKQFSEEEVRKIGRDILEILIYLHTLKPPILHRDIKPSNLILAENEQIYLIDFGAVQNRTVATGGTFTVVGTYGYAPIEQYGGQAIPASDIYALGATLIHLLTGIPPSDLPLRDLRIQYRDNVGSEVSLFFLRWLDKMTEPALEKRFSSAIMARDAVAGRLSVERDIPEQDNQEIPVKTRVVLNRYPDRLEISIPARVEIELIEPCQDVLNRAVAQVKGYFYNAKNRLQDSEILTKRSSALVRLGLAGGGLVLLGVSLPILLSILQLAILLIQATVFIGIFVIAGNWLAHRRSYFERTYAIFDSNKFLIECQGVWLLNYRRYKGEIGDILDVSVAPFNERRNLPDVPPQLGVVVTVQLQGLLERYGFGQELSEYELIWLVREIRDWLGGIV